MFSSHSRKSLQQVFKKKFVLFKCNYIVYDEQKILSVTREHYKLPTIVAKVVSHNQLEQVHIYIYIHNNMWVVCVSRKTRMNIQVLG